MGLGSFLKKTWNSATEVVRDAGRQASNNLSDAEDSGLTGAGLQYFVNPLAYQNVLGSGAGAAYARGADARDALAAGNANAGALASGDGQAWGDLAVFNAALIAGAAGGAGVGALMGAGGSMPAVAALSSSALAGGAAAGTGALVAGGLYGGYAASTGPALNTDQSGSLPPDMAAMYANDPNTSAQFQRLRRAAAMLGRAGTIKYKGTSLGGEGALGSELSLTGA
jgi:hypothetical protein